MPLTKRKTYAGSSNTEIFHVITGMRNGLSAATGVGRVNRLFADTINGAKVNAIMYSMIETAKANQANIPIYLQYLFEQIPLH